ncbi:hypothetical protein Fmac_029154 [Flemingia macrophylla]|uniref:Uncharacterized protein n=1 Tax=Flemingia macrophylla TaxID=520843 RepID=A0ABD1L9K3_9FABA
MAERRTVRCGGFRRGEDGDGDRGSVQQVTRENEHESVVNELLTPLFKCLKLSIPILQSSCLAPDGLAPLSPKPSPSPSSLLTSKLVPFTLTYTTTKNAFKTDFLNCFSMSRPFPKSHFLFLPRPPQPPTHFSFFLPFFLSLHAPNPPPSLSFPFPSAWPLKPPSPPFSILLPSHRLASALARRHLSPLPLPCLHPFIAPRQPLPLSLLPTSITGQTLDRRRPSAAPRQPLPLSLCLTSVYAFTVVPYCRAVEKTNSGPPDPPMEYASRLLRSLCWTWIPRWI